MFSHPHHAPQERGHLPYERRKDAGIRDQSPSNIRHILKAPSQSIPGLFGLGGLPVILIYKLLEIIKHGLAAIERYRQLCLPLTRSRSQ